MGIGERLREERERLALSQEAFGAAGGVRKQAQLLYEKGERQPKADYLSKIAGLGVDIGYVMDGVHPAAREMIHAAREGKQTMHLKPDEAELLTNYRNSPPPVQAALLAASSAGRTAPREMKITRRWHE
jgi:transcriptional regulator with XRE-family HTH domain